MPNVIDLDTMVFVEHYFADPDEMRRFKWTRYLVQRVYPLAMQALDIMSKTDTAIARINKKRKRKKKKSSLLICFCLAVYSFAK
jgi:hypothetical protein